MRIRMRLPVVNPNEYVKPRACRFDGCPGRYFKLHQATGKCDCR